MQAGPGYRLAVSGQCGGSAFRFEGKDGAAGVLAGEVVSPQLWWPRGYGRRLYQLTMELSRDAIIASRQDQLGIRASSCAPAVPPTAGATSILW